MFRLRQPLILSTVKDKPVEIKQERLETKNGYTINSYEIELEKEPDTPPFNLHSLQELLEAGVTVKQVNTKILDSTDDLLHTFEDVQKKVFEKEQAAAAAASEQELIK